MLYHTCHYAGSFARMRSLAARYSAGVLHTLEARMIIQTDTETTQWAVQRLLPVYWVSHYAALLEQWHTNTRTSVQLWDGHGA